jgi:hydroxymethylglutaryl-CoA lyase
MTEVGTRDGLQSEGALISTGDKIRLINALARTGLRRIEVTAFAHPQRVPQMADADEVMRNIERAPGVTYTALVPNVRGAERAVGAGADELHVVVGATDAFNERNVNMSVDASIETYRSIAEVARSAGLRAPVGLAVTVGCPYEGRVDPDRVADVIRRLVDVGVDEVLRADTIGVANPRQVSELVGQVRARWPTLTLGLHFHDTRGLGVANVLAGLEAGVARFDASVGGIGACPFAPGATGNVCTEDTVHMLESMGIRTGVDLAVLTSCARLVREVVGHEVPSRMLRAGPASGVLGGHG